MTSDKGKIARLQQVGRQAGVRQASDAKAHSHVAVTLDLFPTGKWNLTHGKSVFCV